MSSILSSVEGGVVGVAVGTAAAAAVEPIVEPSKQQVWQANPYRVLDPDTLAELVVQALVTYDEAQPQARRSGYDGNKFRAMVERTFRAPDVAMVLELWRRERIAPDQVRHALHKHGLEPQFIGPIMELFYDRLDPAIIATAIQRGIMTDPGFLPVGPPTAGGVVPRFPVSPIDPVAEAQAQGISEDRLFVETAIVGLPASPVEAANAYFRGIIERADFDRAIAEGNTRNEWRDAILEQSRQILTANQYAELQLRGFITEDQRHIDTDKHGMSRRDSDLLFDVLGRGITAHQVTIGLARGGEYTGAATDAPEPWLDALRRSNIRPEWYSLAFHSQRYTYPSAFVIRALLQDQVWTAARGEQILLQIGWPPDMAQEVAAHYTAKGQATNTHISKAQTQLWNTVHRSYMAAEIDQFTASDALTTLAITATTQDQIFRYWDAERELIRKQLTPTQLRKAYQDAVTNPSTGQPWTHDEAKDRLLAMGYNSDDADTFLAERGK